MTNDQQSCLNMLIVVFRGEHHLPGPIRAHGKGIKTTIHGGVLSTFDFDYLTRLVVAAHDRCIRAEILAGGPGRVTIALSVRRGRTGYVYDRHPELGEGIALARDGRAFL